MPFFVLDADALPKSFRGTMIVIVIGCDLRQCFGLQTKGQASSARACMF